MFVTDEEMNFLISKSPKGQDVGQSPGFSQSEKNSWIARDEGSSSDDNLPPEFQMYNKKVKVSGIYADCVIETIGEVEELFTPVDDYFDTNSLAARINVNYLRAKAAHRTEFPNTEISRDTYIQDLAYQLHYTYGEKEIPERIEKYNETKIKSLESYFEEQQNLADSTNTQAESQMVQQSPPFGSLSLAAITPRVPIFTLTNGSPKVYIMASLILIVTPKKIKPFHFLELIPNDKLVNYIEF